ncbi:MAG: hypothetical protein PHQ27_00895 [Victivallales bacterium]|nr:hypothetical protein [Victivallales bacterium]
MNKNLSRLINHQVATEYCDGPSRYRDCYLKLFASADSINIADLENGYTSFISNLHPDACDTAVDSSILAYVLPRLPSCIPSVSHVILAPAISAITDPFFAGSEWKPVSAQARRRFARFNGHDTLVMFLNSISDIDDIIPCLSAFQLEWNKMHRLFADFDNFSGKSIKSLSANLGLSVNQVTKFATFWDNPFRDFFELTAKTPKHLRVTLRDFDHNHIIAAVDKWIAALKEYCPLLTERDRPFYFVSSNLHSLANMIGGYGLARTADIDDFLSKHSDHAIAKAFHLACRKQDPYSLINLRYYALPDFLGHTGRTNEEQCHIEDKGIVTYRNLPCLQLDAQVFDLTCSTPDTADLRIRDALARGKKEQAVILNIDYPLGALAAHILERVAIQIRCPDGVFIMGKAATLQDRVGDIMLPNMVYDIHSRHLYNFSNSVRASILNPLTRVCRVKEQEYALTVWSPIMVDYHMMRCFHQLAFNSIEMEAGQFLEAFARLNGIKITPESRSIDFREHQTIPFGLIHYASDAPLNENNLLSTSMGLSGVEAVNVCAAGLFNSMFVG